MRLIKLKLQRFRRFAEEQSLDLNEDLVALVGPNEAGKSSVLAAIELLGGEEHPSRSDSTRGLDGKASVSGLFVLDPEDRSLLASIHQGGAITHAWVELREGADRQYWSLSPEPTRNLQPRRDCGEVLSALEGNPALSAEFSIDEEVPWEPQLWVDVRAYLDSEDETLPEVAIESLTDVARRLRGIQFPPESVDGEDEVDGAEAPEDDTSDALEAAARSLEDLAATERQPTPVRQALDALGGRLPEVAYFKEQDRQLARDYQLAEVAADPPPALANLCALAELNLAAVQADIEAGRVPHVEKVFEESNRRLKERFQSTWSQSNVYPRLSNPSDGVLRIFIATEGEADYSFPEERSDGLRWFMALHSFLAARGAKEPILLVDEAETHLHYDAQADLIDALMNQKIASKVIYTTHSVGCLPPDLGCGLRVVVGEDGTERSRIVNSYWSVNPDDDERIGYAPLLFAMGAQMLALTVPRCALITEGPADAVLLPTLFREAAGLDRLSYRVVPGLSELAGERVDSLHRHGGRIACLTDDDPGGAAIRGKLSAGAVAEDLVFHLGVVLPNASLEDLVDGEVFAEAVNNELETWGLGPFRVSPTDLPSTGRWEWLEAQGVATETPTDKLSKVRVAQRVVDVGRRSEPSPRPVLRSEIRDQMRQLNENISASLGG